MLSGGSVEVRTAKEEVAASASKGKRDHTRCGSLNWIVQVGAPAITQLCSKVGVYTRFFGPRKLVMEVAIDRHVSKHRVCVRARTLRVCHWDKDAAIKQHQIDRRDKHANKVCDN